jgi:hypothetical protein
VVDSQGEIIRVERTLYVIENMRYLDLEHEVGHIEQLQHINEESNEDIFTHRFIEKNGRQKESRNADKVLTGWQDIITEYHNRLVEFIRLYDRKASSELLQEHAKGLEEWAQTYWHKGIKQGRSEKQVEWSQKYFPDIDTLRSRYFEIIKTIKQ